jgi:hypothetical protein
MSTVLEYRGFQYCEVPPSTILLYLDHMPWQRFDNVVRMNGFVDQIHAALEVALKQFHLHLTGCKRCKRTMDGIKADPCKRGVHMIVDAKRITLEVCAIFAKARAEVPLPQ